MLKEFKAFISRGSVVDLAVAVILGAAFGAIVNSFVNDIIMPVVGVILGGIDFSGLAIMVGSATVGYGKFIQAIVTFLIIAATLFFVLKGLGQMKPKAPAAPALPPEPSAEEKLLGEIRDLLRQR